jgi:hypothetical protein
MKDFAGWILYILAVIYICVVCSGCFAAGRHFAIGLGKKQIEYYEDGSVKKEHIETKSLLEQIFSFAPFAVE